MDIQELLAKAFDIGNTITFTVKKYIRDKHIETDVLTYTELGMFLVNNKDNILSVNIIQKK